MSSSDSESTYSDLTDASVKSVKSVAGSPVIQDLDITMETHSTVGSTVGSGDDDKNSASASMAQILASASTADAPNGAQEKKITTSNTNDTNNTNTHDTENPSTGSALSDAKAARAD